MAKQKQRRALIPLPPRSPLYIVRHNKDTLPLIMRYEFASIDDEVEPTVARVRFNGKIKTRRRRKTERWFADASAADAYVKRICAQVISCAHKRIAAATIYAHTYPVLTANV